MVMLKALRHPAIARLWVGQALSAIGDEIYRVGLIWLAVGLIGEDTGYLSAAQAAALMILSFIGGKWADHWDPLRTMIRVDFVRGFIVLVPVVYSFFAPVTLSLLVVVALAISALGAFFDPALQTVLPKFSPDTPTLRAATGLMGTTVRMARMIGPLVVGLLAGFIPAIHFFTLDAISFFVSAYSVRPLRDKTPKKRTPIERRPISFGEAIFSGFHALRKKPGMTYILWAKGIGDGTWALAYGLALALLVQKLASHDTRSFGLVVAAYGVGNFAGAVYFGNQERKRPALMMFSGIAWLGAGFIWMAYCWSIPSLMLASMVTGFSGIMNEITFCDLVQARFPSGEITRIFRLRMAVGTAITLVLMLPSPWLFRVFGVSNVFAACGVVWIFVAIGGFIFARKKLDEVPPELTVPHVLASGPAPTAAGSLAGHSSPSTAAAPMSVKTPLEARLE